MLIRCGYNISFDCPAQTSMLLLLNVHPSRSEDLRAPDVIKTKPDIPLSSYHDAFGNIVTRAEIPPGEITFYNDFTVYDSGELDERPMDTPLTPVSQLPNDTLLFLIASRYCDSDNVSNFAWSKFANLGSGRRTVEAIVQFAHDHITFSYADARPTRTASDALRERIGVCRDYSHLAISLCRAMNIPARYATGYLGDIGVPPDGLPMDFSAWFEVFLNGRWYTFDARHNRQRIGRIVMARGRDAADAALTTSFGMANLKKFEVTTYEMTE
ncbi:MAG: transglutaminase-like domain-containing protein [Beijerinckiaceae bacterium]